MRQNIAEKTTSSLVCVVDSFETSGCKRYICRGLSIETLFEHLMISHGTHINSTIHYVICCSWSNIVDCFTHPPITCTHASWTPSSMRNVAYMQFIFRCRQILLSLFSLQTPEFNEQMMPKMLCKPHYGNFH